MIALSIANTASRIWRILATGSRYARYAAASKFIDPAKKAYATNLYLYYVTEAGSNEEFNAMMQVANQLSSYQTHPGVWQYRFEDTLARYFHRRSGWRVPRRKGKPD